MFLKRSLSNELKRYIKFPVIGIFGPRQSGKTTLVRSYFDKHVYLNFEDPDIRAFAASKPRNFLQQHENEYGIILDEFQYVPEILSYIQMESDQKDRPGYFVLTGSQNFLMNQAVTQSLAGRIAILTLLPFSFEELAREKLLPENINDLILQGGYPRLYDKKMSPKNVYPSYIHSYIERDVRQIINVENLATFQKFMQLCAGRVGQLLNKAELATACGIGQKTIQSWLSILEASYIIFMLQPYYGNFNKRITKTPKLYFYDTGLVCSLLGMTSSHEVALSPFRGSLFECLIISDIFKQYFNNGYPAPVYFWRDANGRVEVDCLIARGERFDAIEIKSGDAYSKNYFDGLMRWNEIAAVGAENNYVIYGGPYSQKLDEGKLVSWLQVGDLVTKRLHDLFLIFLIFI